MNLLERKENTERLIARTKIEIDALIDRRERLVSSLGALIGQVQLIDELLNEQVTDGEE